MMLSGWDGAACLALLAAVLTSGTNAKRVNLIGFSVQSVFLAVALAIYAYFQNQPYLYMVALLVYVLKAMAAPLYLNKILKMDGSANAGPNAHWLPQVCLALSCTCFFLTRFMGSNEGDLQNISIGLTLSLLACGMVITASQSSSALRVLGVLTMSNALYLLIPAMPRSIFMMCVIAIVFELVSATTLWLAQPDGEIAISGETSEVS